jgi:hypothetical protein
MYLGQNEGCTISKINKFIGIRYLINTEFADQILGQTNYFFINPV